MTCPKSSRLAVGIDPGFGGAVALMNEHYHVTNLWDMPLLELPGKKKRIDRESLRLSMDLVLSDERPSPVVVIEAVGARAHKDRKEGTSSQFRFGQGQGEVLGLMTGIGLFVFEVAPQVWKARMGVQGMDEERTCLHVAKLFPEVKDRMRGPRGRWMHDRAEAVLMARYARMIADGR